MGSGFYQKLQVDIEELKTQGLYKSERVITSPQRAAITSGGHQVINMCSNNYLGLSDHPDLVTAAQATLESRGFGMSSVRFICGTLDIHKQLEAEIAGFLGKEDCILYSSCFDANAGLFETLLGPEDAIISDALNHASIIDGVRLCKAKRFRYANNDMKDLESKLKESKDARFRMIATDGVFSMDGIIADLGAVCELADKYDALVMVDDSHAVGFLGEGGRGSPAYCGVEDRVDIMTGTLGKALGGASGGYTAGKGPVVEWLRQRSRPYLFSNTLAPAITGASISALELLKKESQRLEKLRENAAYFREKMAAAGFRLLGKDHPIIPVLIEDAPLAVKMAEGLLKEGIYVIAFSYPVVPKGLARIRTQISAGHSRVDLDQAIAAFIKVGKQMGVVA